MPDTLDSKSTALVAIDFHGDQIVTFQRDGLAYVAMRRVCDNLRLNWAGQHSKLVENADKFSCMDIHTAGADGKVYAMLAMPVSKLPLWLATVNPNKIPDAAKRQKIELYQEESAIALHDYWTKGVAIRGDTDGLVTGFDKDTMNALGGMLKGIVRKALLDLRQPIEDGALLSSHASVSRGYTAGEILDEAGVSSRKGMRGLPRRVSDALRRYAAERGVAVSIGRLGSSSAYVFDGSLVRVWLREGGKQFIERLVEERSGQGALKLVVR